MLNEIQQSPSNLKDSVISIYNSEEDTDFSDAQLFPGYQLSNTSLNASLSVYRNANPIDIVKNMSREEFLNLKKKVVLKYSKSSNINTYKKKNRREFEEFRDRAKDRKYIESVRLKSLETEKNLSQIKLDIEEYQHQTATPFIKKLNLKVTETKQIGDLTKIIPKDLPVISTDISFFNIPTNRFMLVDPKYKRLHDNFLGTIDKIRGALDAINLQTENVVPLNNELSCLELEIERNLADEQRLLEIDLNERTEKVILEKISKAKAIKASLISEHSENVIVKKKLPKVKIVDRDDVMNEIFGANPQKKHRQFSFSNNSNALIEEMEKRKEATAKLLLDCEKIRNHINTKVNNSHTSSKNMSIEETKKLFQKRKTEIFEKIVYEELMRRNKLKAAQRIDKKTIPKPKSTSKVIKDTEFDEISVPEVEIIETKQETGFEEPVKILHRHLPVPTLKPTINNNSTLSNSIQKEHKSTKFPFICDPVECYFDDYIPKKTNSQTIKITNISLTVNALKILSISETLVDYITFEYKPIGRMSAGINCDLTLHFNPPADLVDDIDGFVLMQAEIGGILKYPIGCRGRKCTPKIVSVSDEYGNVAKFGDSIKDSSLAKKIGDSYFNIKFGACISGGVVKRKLTIQNLGCIETDYSIFPITFPDPTPIPISPEIDQEITETVEQIENLLIEPITNVTQTPNSFEVAEKEGKIPAKGKTTIVICFFAHEEIETKNVDYEIKFSNQLINSIKLTFSAFSLAPPIRVESNIVEMGIASFLTTKKQKLILFNSGTTSQKFVIGLDHSPHDKSIETDHHSIGSLILKSNFGTVEFIPRIGYIQPKNHFPLRIKFVPSDLNKTTSDVLINLPMKVSYTVNGINSVISFNVTGTCTTNKIDFQITDCETNVKNFDFGNLSIGSIAEKQILVTNRSSLKREIRFQSLNQHNQPSTFLSTPTPILQVNANETKSIFVQYTPTEIGHKKLKFKLFQPEFPLDHHEFVCTVNGVSPHLRFSKMAFSYGSVAIGSKFSSLVAVNCDKFVEDRPDHLPWLKKIKGVVGKNEENEISFEFLTPLLQSINEIDPSDHNGFAFPENTLTNLVIFPKSGKLSSGTKVNVRFSINPSFILDGVIQSIKKQIESLIEEKKIEFELEEEKIRQIQQQKDQEATALLAAKKGGKAKPATLNKRESIMPIEGNLVVEEKIEPVLVETPKLEIKYDFFNKFVDTIVKMEIPCVMKKVLSLKRQNSLFISNEKSKDISGSIEDPQIVSFKTEMKIVKPDIVFNSFDPLKFFTNINSLPDLEQNLDIDEIIKSLFLTTFEFGTVPVGKKTTMSIKIRNISSSTIKLTSSPLNPHGPFYLLKALRQIESNDTFDLKVSFEPRRIGSFISDLKIQTETSLLSVKLRGDGVVPTISIECLPGGVRFDDLMINDDSTRDFCILNPCHFPITCDFSWSNTSGDLNTLREFSLLSSTILIPPSSKENVTVKFSPTKNNDECLENINVCFWGQVESFTIPVLGRSWDTSSAVIGHLFSPINQNTIMPQNSLQNITTNGALPTVFHCGILRNFWKQSSIDNSWDVELNELIVINLKPSYKMENVGKNVKAIACQYSIEKLADSSQYNSLTGIKAVSDENTATISDLDFDFESSAGTVENGTTKPLVYKPQKKKVVNVGEVSEKTGKKKVDKNVNAAEIPFRADSPQYFESYFKITIKGGYQNIEPKGVSNICQGWIIKMTAEVE